MNRSLIKWLLPFIIFSFANSSVAEQSELLVGSWYGEKQKDTQTQKWLVIRSSDGKFSLKTKIFIDEYLLMEKTQEGEWSLKDGIYNAKTTHITDLTGSYAPLTPEGYYLDQYEIIELSPTLFTYKHTGSGSIYSVKRVADDFTF